MRTTMIALVLLAASCPVLGAERIDECGFIRTYDGGYWFRPLSAPYRTYGLNRYWGGDDFVRMVGEVVPCSEACEACPQDSCIVDVTELDCPPRDLGCGIRRGYPDILTPCCFWDSFQYGRVELSSPYCGSDPGDTVHVYGILDHVTSNPICLYGPPSLLWGIVQGCSDTVVGPRIEQTACDTLSLDPLLMRIQFDILTSAEAPVCRFTLFPDADSCLVQNCTAPEGWDCYPDNLGDGRTLFSVDYDEDCSAPGDRLGPFELTIRPAYCCVVATYYKTYRVRDPYFGQTLCFECDRPVQVEGLTWGQLKAMYR